MTNGILENRLCRYFLSSRRKLKRLESCGTDFHDLTGRRNRRIKFLISGWLWQTYEGQGLGAIPITPQYGIAVNERTIGFIDSLIGIVGNQVHEEITLEKPSGEPHRYHFVGFPEPPANYETFGDLLVRGVSHEGAG